MTGDVPKDDVTPEGNVHSYAVAPATAETVQVPVSDPQELVGPVSVAGVAKILVVTKSKIDGPEEQTLTEETDIYPPAVPSAK